MQEGVIALSKRLEVISELGDASEAPLRPVDTSNLVKKGKGSHSQQRHLFLHVAYGYNGIPSDHIHRLHRIRT